MPPDANAVTIYADGAASPNPNGPGGYGVVLIRDGQRQELSGGFRSTTNNRMELMGAIVGLKSLHGQKSVVTIYSDSKYLVNMFMGGYAHEWRRMGWRRHKGKYPAMNPDLWDELLTVAALHEVTFVWVRGHGDNAENVRCDELAVLARQGKDLPPDDGYENPRVPVSPEGPSLFDLFRQE